MANEEKKSKSQNNLVRIFIAIIIIIIAFSLLNGLLKKMKKERQEYKKNNAYKVVTQDGKIVDQKARTNTKRKGNGIGDIDIPGLFGTEVPKINENIENSDISEKDNDNNNDNINTKENINKEYLEKNKYPKIDPNFENNLKQVRKNSKSTLEKYLKDFNGNAKKARTLYFLNLIRMIMVPILFAVLFISYIYEKIFNKKDDINNQKESKKGLKNGIKIRIRLAIAIAIISFIPYIYTLFVKGWRI